MEQIRGYLERISGINIEQLERKDLEFNFSDVFPLIRRYDKSVKLLEANPEILETLPIDRMNNLKGFLNQFAGALEEIRDFDPTTVPEPAQKRGALVDQVKNQNPSFYTGLYLPLQLYMLDKTLDPAKIERIFKEVDGAKTKVIDLQKEAEAVVTAIRGASAATGVSSFAGVFAKQAKTHIIWAVVWGIVSFVGAAGIAVFLYVIFNQLIGAIKPDSDVAVSIQVFLAKILLLSFFSVVFYYLVKNFTANMHLYTLNKHRANSLQTFQVFVESTDDPKVKDAVLIQTTRAIFEAGNTGYIASKEARVTGLDTFKFIENIDKGA